MFKRSIYLYVCVACLSLKCTHTPLIYSPIFGMCRQTCIKRSPLGQRKSDLLRQVTS